MNKILPPEMLEAARLTKAGKLAEATALIQRLLNGHPPAGDSNPPASGGEEAAPGLLSRVGHWLKRHHDDGPEKPPGSEAGQFLARTFTNQAGTRAYKLYIPRGYHGQKVPLIVMLHGCTQSPDDFAAGTGMNAAAERAVCLVAYPAQTRKANLQKCWNWFHTADQQRDAGEPSLIAGITRQIMHDYAVDSRRIYVAGISAGGAAASIMGNTYPDLYAAIGVHSGLACGAAHDMKSALVAMQRGGGGAAASVQVPTIVFHGDRDTTVNPSNGDAVAAQAAGANSMTTRTRDAEAPGGYPYTLSVTTNAAGRTMIEQWTVHGAGHAWSGGNPAGSFTDPKGPDATKEMLRFFLEHPHTA